MKFYVHCCKITSGNVGNLEISTDPEDMYSLGADQNCLQVCDGQMRRKLFC
jgi:hypothetical protein